MRVDVKFWNLYWLCLIAVLGIYPHALHARVAHEQLTQVTVQLNWRHQFEFAAFYAAIAQGYYKSEGLQVSLIEGGPSIDSVEEVVAGRAQFGVSSSALILEHSRGMPVKALGVFMQHSAIALLGSRARGINSVMDLDGKSLSCSPHACEETKAYLKMSGIDPSAVKFVELKDPSALKRLESVDATEIYWTNAGYGIHSDLDNYVLMLPRSAGIDVYGNALFTTESVLAENPETVRKFRDATFRGLRYAQENQQELVDLIVARYNSQAKTPEHLHWEAEKLNELMRTDLVEAGYMSEGRWTHIRDVFASVGLLPPDYDFLGMLYSYPEKKIPRWVYGSFFALATLLLLAFAFSVRMQRLNQKLEGENRLRVKAEDDLRNDHQKFRSFVERAHTLISHELRTPLSVIKLHLNILELKASESDNGVRRADIDAMLGATRRLEELFQRNFDEAFATAERVSKHESVDTSATVRTLVDEFTTMKQGSIAFGYMADKARVRIALPMLRTLLFNLLDNARKYSPEGADTRIDVETNDDQVVLAVRNPMAFDPPENLEHLLQKSARGKASVSVPGTGIGLYLVQLIAVSHQGRIALDIDAEGQFTARVLFPKSQDADSAR